MAKSSKKHMMRKQQQQSKNNAANKNQEAEKEEDEKMIEEEDEDNLVAKVTVAIQEDDDDNNNLQENIASDSEDEDEEQGSDEEYDDDEDIYDEANNSNNNKSDAKKQRIVFNANSANNNSILDPYRAVGFVNDASVPVSVHKLGNENWICASIGKTYHIYNSKLRLTYVGPHFPKKISCIQIHNRRVFVASGHRIYLLRRSEIEHVFEGPHSKAVTHFMLMGEKYLVSFGKDRKCVLWYVPNTFSKKLRTETKKPEVISVTDLKEGEITCVCHPQTYLDKVLVGTAEGYIDLYNFKSKKHIYRFGPFAQEQQQQQQQQFIFKKANTAATATTKTCAITVIEPSPALDVVAIGLSDGRILLHNLKHDITLFSFTHAPGPVTSLTFRSDFIAFTTGATGGSTPGATEVLASGNASGEIAIWDLNKRRIITTIHNASSSSSSSSSGKGISSLRFFDNEPVMLAAGENSIREYIFDTEDGTGRLLRQIGGHSKAATKVRFFDPSSFTMMSAGLDRALRLSSVNTMFMAEYSQGHVGVRAKKLGTTEEEVKLTPVTDFAVCHLRHDDWANVVTAHAGLHKAYTWRSDNCVIGEHVLVPMHASVIKCVALSSCGNFAIVGGANGTIDKFNMQSGLHRGMFVDKNLAAGRSVPVAHEGPVHGICMANLDVNLVSAGFDGRVKFWNFKELKLEAEFDVGSPITLLRVNSSGALVAVATDDCSIRIYDTATHKLVRHFVPTTLASSSSRHGNRINDIAFSPDSKLLVSCSMDGHIRIWDTMSATLVEWFHVPKPATSISFHPNGIYVATTHSGSVGLYLWTNKLMFHNVHFKHVTAPTELSLPGTSLEFKDDVDNNKNQDAANESKKGQAEEEEEEGAAADYFEGEDQDDNDNNNNNHNNKRKRSEEAEQQDNDNDNKEAMIALSGLPRPRWAVLPNLDTIKERNKPTKPVQKKEAPFFLPTLAGINPVFDVAAAVLDNEKQNADAISTKSKIISTRATDRTAFMRLIHYGAQQKNGDYSKAMEALLLMSPSQIDVEVRTMNNYDDLIALIEFLDAQMRTHSNFEFLQAVLNLVLKCHAEVIARDPQTVEALRRLKQTQAKCWARIEDLFNASLCLTQYFTGNQF